jgi:hypothetical protein
MKNLVMEKIQQAKLRLDYNVKDENKRVKIVEDILEDIQDYLDVYLYGAISERVYREAEQFTKDYFDEKKEVRLENRAFVNRFLEHLANYICYAKDEELEKRKQRKFEERDVINNNLIAGGGDGLRADSESQAKNDMKIYFEQNNEQSFTGNYKKKKKQVISSKDVKKSEILQQYQQFRKNILNIKRNKHLESKELYEINKALGGLRDDMIWIKDMENGTIYFKSPLMDSGSSKSSLFVKDTWDYMEKNYSDDELKCDFFDPDHYDTILKVLPFNNLSDNLRGIYKRFEMLETYLNLSDDKHKMLEVLKEGKSIKYDKLFYKSSVRRDLIKNNKEAVYDLKSLKNKLGWTYKKTQEMYYRLQKDCYDAFIEMYEEEFYYMYICKGKYKQCSKCGEIKLVQRFGIDSRNNDGYKSICRKCDAKSKK